MESNIPTDLNRAIHSGWHMIFLEKYPDGSPRQGTFIAPSRCIDMRDLPKKRNTKLKNENHKNIDVFKL